MPSTAEIYEPGFTVYLYLIKKTTYNIDDIFDFYKKELPEKGYKFLGIYCKKFHHWQKGNNAVAIGTIKNSPYVCFIKLTKKELEPIVRELSLDEFCELFLETIKFCDDNMKMMEDGEKISKAIDKQNPFGVLEPGINIAKKYNKLGENVRNFLKNKNITLTRLKEIYNNHVNSLSDMEKFVAFLSEKIDKNKYQDNYKIMSTFNKAVRKYPFGFYFFEHTK